MATGKSIIEKQDIEDSDERSPLHPFSPDEVLKPHPAVFPELPSPLKRIYVRARNLNKLENANIATSPMERGDDAPEKTAVEVGLKWTF